MRKECDYIGFDPVAWVSRLEDVNDRSQFTDAQKRIIARGLTSLRLELQAAR